MQLQRPRAEPASSSSSITKLLPANVKPSRVGGWVVPVSLDRHKHFTQHSPHPSLSGLCNAAVLQIQWFWGISPFCSPALKWWGKKRLCAFHFSRWEHWGVICWEPAALTLLHSTGLLANRTPTSFWAMLWSIVAFEWIYICLLELVFQGRLQSFVVPCFFSQQSVPSGCEWLCLTVYIDICVPV